MSWRAGPVVASILAVAACGKPSGPPAGAGSQASPAAGDATLDCQLQPFASSTPVPEASGTTWLTIDGKLMLLVVGDSGNRGAYGLVDPESGATVETGRLPLADAAGDDIEGVAAKGELIYGLTSAGWVRVWRRDGKGFALVGGPYPLGPVDLPDTKTKQPPPIGQGMVCGPRGVNCGRNYEGLCLARAPSSPGCIGFAASKADGHLYCLTEEAGQLVVHGDRSIEVARPRELADCTFDEQDQLWAGSNIFGLGELYRVTGWDNPATAQVHKLGAVLLGNPEVLAVRGDIVYRMSDGGGSPSLMARYRCSGLR